MEVIKVGYYSLNGCSGTEPSVLPLIIRTPGNQRNESKKVEQV